MKCERGYILAGTTNFSVRMDSDIKKQCETLYSELGMNLTTAINVFLRQSLCVGGFPLKRVPGGYEGLRLEGWKEEISGK